MACHLPNLSSQTIHNGIEMKSIKHMILIFLLGLNVACSTHNLREGAVAGKTQQVIQQQILVTLANSSDDELAQTAASLAETYRLKQIAAWPIAVLDIHCFIYEIEPQQSSQAIVKILKADPRVESVQPMHLFEVMTYNDPYLKLQNNVEQTPIEKVHRWTTGKGVKIAIVDSGVETQHPDLHQQIVKTKNFVGTDKADGIIPSGDVHGTAVAGVIAARPNNLIGIVGVAPDAELIALRACWPRVAGSRKALCNSFTLARALSVAIQKKVDIINLSLAGPEDPLLARIINAALEQSICVIAADTDDPHAPRFPAKLPGVIGVHSLGEVNTNKQSSQSGSTPKLSAPGTDILTTVPKDSYDFMSGSSLATASVSGMVALLLEHKPGLTPTQIYHILLSSTQVSQHRESMTTTKRAINLCAAITQIRGKDICS